jgi:hypothetical protein
MDTAIMEKDRRVAIHHWAPRFVWSGVPLTDFEEVTADSMAQQPGLPRI